MSPVPSVGPLPHPSGPMHPPTPPPLCWDPDFPQELAVLAYGCDLLLPPCFKKQLPTFPQVRGWGGVSICLFRRGEGGSTRASEVRCEW